MENDARRLAAATAKVAAEGAARLAYGRLLALLAARTRDLAAAQDALADAFETALRTWPRDGVPNAPEAWLMAAAKHRLVDDARHRQVRDAAEPQLVASVGTHHEDPPPETAHEALFPDERLKLLFVCAHPAIAAEARTPLMLQTVLGLEAGAIASAFLVAPKAMGQRLVRAKARIRDTGIAFEVPQPEAWAARLDAVLEAIYAAYGTGWDDVTGADPRRRGLADEALWLARTVVQLLPQEPEPRGLLALMLHCEARRGSRRDAAGAYVPLAEQDTARWSRPMIVEAEQLLAAAARLQRLGHFQLEAAIQSAHAMRGATGCTAQQTAKRTAKQTNWPAIALLYQGLVACSPTLGARLGHAAALAEALDATHGLAALEAIEDPRLANHQPHWALRAHLLRRLGREAEAQVAYQRAIGLAEDPAIRAFLLARAAAPQGDPERLA